MALVTALLTAGLIVFGAVVRVTDSGLGCGNDWPLCDGRIVPPLDNLTAWIEWLHRLFALLIGLSGIGMLALAIRAYRRQNQIVLQATIVAAVLFAVQSALGAMVVIFDLPPTMVTLHLGTAMLLLGALLVAVVSAWYRPARQDTFRRDQFLMLAYFTTALSLLIILTGALVRGSGATLACLDWPLCNGEVFPFQQGQLQTVHMLHRFAVGGLGIALVLLVRFIGNERNGLARNLAVGALAVYIMQALVGALFVWTEAAPEWGALHVGLAAALWSLLVALCAVKTLDQQPAEIKTQWKPSSETALN
jgi:heme A synthase